MSSSIKLGDGSTWCNKLLAYLENKYGEVIRRRMVFAIEEIETKIGKKRTSFKLKVGELE